MGAAFDLTGVWDGRFTYPQAMAPVAFQAVLFEHGSGFSGTIWESSDDPQDGAATLNASVEGRRDGSRVEFVKRYDGGGGRSHAVFYAGELRDEGLEICGRWTIPGVWSGGFMMIRPRRVEEAAERETAERAS